jgi:predicted 2-oxoglutarate/Fe(II)-dependent dioxygenase YbiX
MVQVNRKAVRFHDAGMIDSFEVKSFLSPAECAGLRAAHARARHADLLPRRTTHEVLPVTHGERFTIVSWCW